MNVLIFLVLVCWTVFALPAAGQAPGYERELAALARAPAGSSLPRSSEDRYWVYQLTAPLVRADTLDRSDLVDRLDALERGATGPHRAASTLIAVAYLRQAADALVGPSRDGLGIDRRLMRIYWANDDDWWMQQVVFQSIRTYPDEEAAALLLAEIAAGAERHPNPHEAPRSVSALYYLLELGEVGRVQLRRLSQEGVVHPRAQATLKRLSENDFRRPGGV